MGGHLVFTPRRFALLIIVALVAVVALTPRVQAQPTPGCIGVYFDAAGTQQTKSGVVPYAPAGDVYVVAFQPDGMEAYEFSLTLPPGALVSGGRSMPPGCTDFGAGDDNWIVGTGGLCLGEGQQSQWLVKYAALLFLSAPGNDAQICLHGATPSSFPTGEPGYLRCNSAGDIHPFPLCPGPCGYPAGCAVINPSQPNTCPHIDITVAHGFGDVGTLVDVPVTVARTPPKAGDPSDLSGLDLNLSWNGSIATLEQVALTPATAGWLMESNALPGAARISMASLTGIDVPPTGLQVLMLRFRMGSSEGGTPLDFTSARAFDGRRDAIDHTTYSGSLTAGCEKADPVDDDEVNSADAILTLEIGAGEYTPSVLEFCAADMNSDGAINTGDAVLVLRRAVGLAQVPPALAKASHADLQLGDGIGEVVLDYDSVAGLEAVFAYDSPGLEFVSASAPGTNGLTVANDTYPGYVKIAFARPVLNDGAIRLQFIPNGGGAVRLIHLQGYDESGQPQALEVGSSEAAIAVTAVEGALLGRQAVRLYPAQPNPFNPSTLLRFVVPASCDASLRIVDAAGRTVRTFRLAGLLAGEHSVVWNGRDEGGAVVASGSYLVSLEALGVTQTARVTLLK